jgi:sialate O-acetylesterase
MTAMKYIFIGWFTLLATAFAGHAAVKVSGVFADQMVLQRETAVPVWGRAEPGEAVTVEFAGQKKSAVAGSDGKWLVKLDALQASTESRTLTVSGKTPGGQNSIVKLSDVLVGDVWLCSGQSNMEFPMNWLKDTAYAGDLASANFPFIRQGAVPRDPSVEPRTNAAVSWTVCMPQTVGQFTAVGFYFALEVQKHLDVPIGLIQASWGGTSAESWTSKDALDTVPDFKARADEQLANLARLSELIKNFPAALAAWETANGRVDTENLGEKNGWANTDADTADWKPAKLNAKWSASGLTNGGVIWLLKEVVLPAAVAGKNFHFDPGLVDEQYLTVYWNGHKIGESGRQAPQFYYGYVNFDVPAKYLQSGTNVLALRFVVPTGDKRSLGRHAIELGFLNLGLKELNDDCLVRIEKEFPSLTKAALASRPAVPKGDAAHTSTTLFGGMIAPLVPFAIKGVLWYQGEQDAGAGRVHAYHTLLPLMINDWRSRWDREIPFVIQQLVNWNASGAGNTEWAELREAQALTTKNLTNCGLSVGIDVGEANNVHPKNKREIGRRLALVALAKVYGQPVADAGPVYDSMLVEDGKIRLQFKPVGGLKSSDGTPLRNFTITGEDKVFVPADAKIDGDSVVVSSPNVAKPAAVRYAFINNPEGCNFSNGSDLPAMPFRTDSPPAGTTANK